MLILLSLLSCSSTTTEPETVAEAPTKTIVDVRGIALLPPEQAAVITHAANGLADLCAKSARACELQTLFRENSVPAVAVADAIQVVQTPNVPYPFLVVGNTTTKIVPGSGSFSGAHFRWNPEMPAPLMELLDLGMTDFGAGLALAHELVHAEEHFFRNEPVSHYPENNWIIGELVAHESVHTILNQVTGDRWQHEVVDARIRRIETYIVSQGMDPDLSLNGRPEEDAPAIKRLFPGSDNVTIGLLLAQADIDATAQRIQAIATRRSFDDAKRDGAMIEAMRGFYQQMGFKEE